jgi:glyoxylate reductase
MKIFITRKIQPVAKELLEKEGFKVTVFNKNRPITKEELLKKAKDADAIISLLTEKFDKEVIDQLPKCKIIANFAVGYNNIDVKYANEKGIIVTNTPDVLTEATAETAVSLILACAKRIPEVDRFVRENKFKGWEPELFIGVELKNKTVGIIGAGRIGYETAKRIKAFGTKIIYYNRSRKENFEKELNAKKVSLNKLLKTADIISLHIPLNSETHHLLNKDNLQLLKPTAILVNTARGEVVDEKYLIRMLKKKKIFSAGFDVYENEPNLNPELFKLTNVVLLPHIGSATNESRSAIAELAAKNVIRVLKGKKPVTPVKV